jgi:ketosteroid isomerase-like protein
MKTTIVRAFLAAVLLAAPFATHSADSATPAATKADSAELAAFKKVIRAKYDMKEKAFAAHDAETILTRFYAEDAMSIGEGYGIFRGRAQLRPLYEQAVKELTVKVTSRNTVLNGNAGWDWADFYVTPVDPKQKPFNLAILFLWSKVDGQWICKGDFYVYGDIASGKVAAPPP